MVKGNKQLVKEAMRSEIFTVHPDDTLFHAAVLMASKEIGTLPVINEEKALLGILTDRDIVTRCNAVGKDVRKAKVFECMSTNPIRVVPSTSVSDAIMIMAEYGVKRLPVVEKDKLVGIISVDDIARIAEPPTMSCIDNGSYPVCTFVHLAKAFEKCSHNKEELTGTQR